MKDLTQGSITRHLIELSSFMAISMFFQTLYYLVDLYFVSSLGKASIAGVAMAGNLMMATVALTQTLGVGTMSLIAQAAGRKDRADAQTVFNQSFVVSLIAGVLVTAFGLYYREAYCSWLSHDAATIREGSTYLLWFFPAIGLQFTMISMGSALRGTGIVKPTMVLQVVTVILNLILAPVLIVGWGTGKPMGVAGAAIASLIAMAAGVLLLTTFFVKLESFVGFDRALFRPRLDVWKRMFSIGLPAGGEFAVISVFTALIYWIIRDFGPAAQAGYGVGQRVMQSFFLPVIAVSFSASPLAGQNFGARRADRVRETFRVAALMATGLMAISTMLCHVAPEAVVGFFGRDPEVIRYGADYLRIVSWGFVISGLVFTSSGIFQALGNTLPPLASSATRFLIFAGPAIWMSRQPGFTMSQLWYWTVATGVLQAVANILLLQREFTRKLKF